MLEEHGATTYTIGRVARNVFVTRGEVADPGQPDAERPQEIDIVEGFSRAVR